MLVNILKLRTLSVSLITGFSVHGIFLSRSCLKNYAKKLDHCLTSLLYTQGTCIFVWCAVYYLVRPKLFKVRCWLIGDGQVAKYLFYDQVASDFCPVEKGTLTVMALLPSRILITCIAISDLAPALDFSMTIHTLVFCSFLHTSVVIWLVSSLLN